MRSLRYGIEVKVSKETIFCDEDGNTILNDDGIKKQIEYQSGRAVRNTLDHFACSDSELLEFYRLGVL